MRREEFICIADRKLRTIYISGEICPAMASKFRKILRSMDDGTNQIIVEINSPGGHMEAGLMMADSVELAASPVTTRVTGEACSMAAVLLVCGKKREALPASTVMIHQGKFWLGGITDGTLRTEVSELERIAALVWKRLDERTGKNVGYWKEACGHQNIYLDPVKALELNVIDSIVSKG